VTYCGSDRKRFQLEVPDSFAKKAGKDYELQGQRKGFKKYWTAETKVDVLCLSVLPPPIFSFACGLNVLP
jgi:hypothetical protein